MERMRLEWDWSQIFEAGPLLQIVDEFASKSFFVEKNVRNPPPTAHYM
jgi:hypothetical protein